MNENELHEREGKQVSRKRHRLGPSFLLAALAVSIMCGSALATDGGSDTGMTSVVNSIDTLTSMVGKVWTLMTSNAYLTTFLALSLLSAGFGIFIRAKRASRR